MLYLGLVGNVLRFLYVSYLRQPWSVLPFELLQGEFMRVPVTTVSNGHMTARVCDVFILKVCSKSGSGFLSWLC